MNKLVESNEKDERTSQMRERLLALGCSVETWDAAACLTALSFASTSDSTRHVWFNSDLGGHAVLDLEYRCCESADSTVATYSDLPDRMILAVAETWLRGVSLEAIRAGFPSDVRMEPAQSSVAPDGAPSVAPEAGAPSSAPRVNAGIGQTPEGDGGNGKDGL